MRFQSLRYRAQFGKRFLGAACALALLLIGASLAEDTSQNTPAKSSTHKAAKKHVSSSKTKSSSASARVSSTKGKASTSRKRRRTARGQQKIDSERAQSIQEALIRAHYLTGEASGKWNQATEDALRRYQGDQGWQTKTVPDSRALIKLGLGPSKDHLLNPESAMTSGLDAPRAASLTPTSQGQQAPVSQSQAAPASRSADPGTVTRTPSAEPVPATSQPDASRPQ